MSREALHQLLQRYLDGDCSEDERRLVEQWYGMLDKKDLPSVPQHDFYEIEQRLWNKIQQHKPSEDQKKVIRSHSLWRRMTVAAALVAALLAVTLYFYPGAEHPEFLGETAGKDVARKVNLSGGRMKVVFEDKSYVILQPGAGVIYPKHFSGSSREVYLKGEALFGVIKNRQKPFLVYNDDVVIRVLGTTFIVRHNKRYHKTEVAVTSGKVVVTEKVAHAVLRRLFHSKSAVELTANQKAVYQSGEGELHASLVEKPQLISGAVAGVSRPDAFSFNETPVRLVLSRLEKAYGIEIETENEEVNHCTFTGDISTQDLYSKLEFICQSIKATYEIKGVKIVIHGKGCS